MKKFVQIFKIFIVVSFFAISNITRSIDIEVANAIAGVLTVASIFVLFVLDPMAKDEK